MLQCQWQLPKEMNMCLFRIETDKSPKPLQPAQTFFKECRPQNGARMSFVQRHTKASNLSRHLSTDARVNSEPIAHELVRLTSYRVGLNQFWHSPRTYALLSPRAGPIASFLSPLSRYPHPANRRVFDTSLWNFNESEQAAQFWPAISSSIIDTYIVGYTYHIYQEHCKPWQHGPCVPGTYRYPLQRRWVQNAPASLLQVAYVHL